MQNDFRVEVRTEDGAIVLAIRGELDLATSPLLEDELERVAATGDSAPLILDLRALEFMDSTGLSVIVRAQQRVQDAGRRFGLIRGRAQVERLLTLTGVAERMTIADSLQELLAP